MIGKILILLVVIGQIKGEIETLKSMEEVNKAKRENKSLILIVAQKVDQKTTQVVEKQMEVIRALQPEYPDIAFRVADISDYESKAVIEMMESLNV